MKLFIQRGYHLASLAPPAKLIYTLFLVFIATGVWSSWVIYSDRVGGDLEGAAGSQSVQGRYVSPTDLEAPSAQPEQAGPALDLPAEDSFGDEAAPAEDLQWPWILDVFHQHLFSVAVVFLILAHLFMLTRLTPWLVMLIVTVGGLSSLLHVFAPVIIHKTAGNLWLMPVSGAAMLVSWTAMIGWTGLAMWTGWGSSTPRGRGADAAG